MNNFFHFIHPYTEKVNITIEFCIFELVWIPNFSLNNLDFFEQICPQRGFPVEHGKTALVRAPMVVTCYIELFHTGADRHNGISTSLLLLVAETISVSIFINYIF